MSEAVPQWLQQNTLLQPFTYFHSSAACRTDAIHVGIDEAGRGCVLGAMVYACFFCPAAPSSPAAKLFSSLKIDDSKRLKETQREETFAELTSQSELFGWGVHAVSPEEISAKMLRKQKYSLNEIAFDATISLLSNVINSCSNVQEVFVDTVGPAAAYQAKLRGAFPGVKITVREKADALYRVVGAASIIAKVVRDRLLAAPQFYEEGEEEADEGGDETAATAAATEQPAAAAPAAEGEEASSAAAAALAAKAKGVAAATAATEERLAAGEAKGEQGATAVAAAAAGGVRNVAAEMRHGHVAATPTTVTVRAAKQQRFLSILFHGRQQQQPMQQLAAHTGEGRKEKRSTSPAAATEMDAEQDIPPEKDVEGVREGAEKKKCRGPPEEKEQKEEEEDKDASPAAAAVVVDTKARCTRAKMELPDGRETREGPEGQEEGATSSAAAAGGASPSFLEATAANSDSSVSCGENKRQPPKEESNNISKAGEARRKRKAKEEQEEEDSSRASAEEEKKESVAAYTAAAPQQDLPLGTGYPSDPTTVAFLRKSFHPVFAFGNIVRFSWSTVQQLQQQHGVHVEWYDAVDAEGGKNRSTKQNEETGAQASIRKQTRITSFFQMKGGRKQDTVITRPRFFLQRGLHPVQSSK